MKTIYKYELLVTDYQEIFLPQGAEILDVQDQRGVLTLWALVETSNPPDKRKIWVLGTGNPIDFDWHTNLEHLATVQMKNTPLVWHVFEEY